VLSRAWQLSLWGQLLVPYQAAAAAAQAVQCPGKQKTGRGADCHVTGVFWQQCEVGHGDDNSILVTLQDIVDSFHSALKPAAQDYKHSDTLLHCRSHQAATNHAYLLNHQGTCELLRFAGTADTRCLSA
jgi:hypothetical protein